MENLFSYPNLREDQVYKWRIVYGQKISRLSLTPYLAKPVGSLQIVDGSNLDYSYKFEDRAELKNLFNQRKQADDILIMQDRLVKDSYYANLVFQNEDGYFTPAQPLLMGTKRTKLINEGKLEERQIRLEDIGLFDSVHLINAMLDLNQVVVPIENVNLF